MKGKTPLYYQITQFANAKAAIFVSFCVLYGRYRLFAVIPNLASCVPIAEVERVAIYLIFNELGIMG